MELKAELKKTYEEFSYLNTQRSLYYRTIVNYMYSELQKREFLFLSDIFTYMTNFSEFEEYTEEECYKDLENLSSWNNVIKYKNDYTMIKSIEEIKKKKFRYQLTEKTRKIENLIQTEFNEINAITAVLDRNLLKNFKEELSKFVNNYADFRGKSAKELYSWWRMIVEAYTIMHNNYINFLQDLNGIDFEKIVLVDDFLIKKNRIKEYLEDFIVGLVEESVDIEKLLLRFRELGALDEIFDKIIEEEHNLLSINKIDKEIKINVVRDKIYNQRDKIYNWFLEIEGYDGEVEVLRRNSMNAIEKILKVAKKLILKNTVNYSRKESYKNIARVFSETENIGEAYKLSALIFGVQETYHLKGEKLELNREEILSVKEEEKLSLVLNKLRKNENKKSRISLQDRSIEKANYRMQVEKDREDKKNELLKYILDNRIYLGKLPKISTSLKNLIIDMIKKGLNKPTMDKIVVLEDKMYKEYKNVELNNMEFRLLYPVDKDDRIIMRTEDGDLNMPGFILEFRGNTSGASVSMN